MNHYTGDDAHKKYLVFVTVNENGRAGSPERVPHEKELYRKYLASLPPASPIAIESVGNWYWMIEAMEQAGHKPILVHPSKAKLLMGLINKTDKRHFGQVCHCDRRSQRYLWEDGPDSLK